MNKGRALKFKKSKFLLFYITIYKNCLDAGIQDSCMSISIMYKIEEMSHEENGDESNKHVHISTRS